MGIIAKREQIEGLHYLTIYDENGVIKAQSEGLEESNADDGTIRFDHDDLSYVCLSDGEVLITLESIKNKFSNK